MKNFIEKYSFFFWMFYTAVVTIYALYLGNKGSDGQYVWYCFIFLGALNTIIYYDIAKYHGTIKVN